MSSELANDGRLCKGRVTLRNGILVCSCRDRIEDHNPFERQWLHIKFLNSRKAPLDFCRDYGLPFVTDVKRENHGGGVCCLPLDRYDYEQRLFELFCSLANRLRRIGGPDGGPRWRPDHKWLAEFVDKHERTIRQFRIEIEKTEEHVLEVGFVKTVIPYPQNIPFDVLKLSRYIVDASSAAILISGIFAAKTAMVRPVFMPPRSTAWRYPNLLACLYLMHWFEYQQGKQGERCLRCDQWLEPGKKERFCGPKCENNYHATESRKRHNLIIKRWLASNDGTREDAEKWLAVQKAKGKRLKDIEPPD